MVPTIDNVDPAPRKSLVQKFIPGSNQTKTTVLISSNQNKSNDNACLCSCFGSGQIDTGNHHRPKSNIFDWFWTSSSLPFYSGHNNGQNTSNFLANKKTENGGRFLPLTCLISTLLFFIVLNIILILWIVISLNLHQNSGFIRKQMIGDQTKKSYLDKNGYRLRIQGDLSMDDNYTLYTNLIENKYNPPTIISDDQQSSTPVDVVDYNVYNYHNFLKIQTNSLSSSLADGDLDVSDLELQSNPIQYGPHNQYGPEQDNSPKNSILLQSNGNVEMKITDRLVIESEKPKRLLQVEQNRLIIEDSSPIMPHFRQEMGGIRMQQLKTDSVVGSVHQDLRIESRTEKLKMDADRMIQIESSYGDIDLKSHGNLWLNVKQIHMNSRMVLLSNLNRARNPPHRPNLYDANNNTEAPLAYQVCICSNGQLFLADESTVCQANENICSHINSFDE